MDEQTHSTWIVTVDAGRPIQAVAAELRNAGLSVERILEFTGTVIGSATAEIAEKARAVPGVVDVSPGQPMHASKR